MKLREYKYKFEAYRNWKAGSTITHNHKLTHVLFYLLVVWSALSAALLGAYIIFVEWIWQGLYYIIWPICAGGLIWRYRIGIKSRLVNWPLNNVLKYLLLAYGMVLIEEVLAATLNHLPEGYSFSLHIIRIGQFWALNIFAFSGMILGSYFITSRYHFSRTEMFCIFGLFGQISENLLYKLLFVPGEALAALVLMPLNFWIYGVIFLPAIFIIEDRPRKNISGYLKFPLVFVVMFFISLPFIWALQQSRDSVHYMFPPTSMIP